MYKLDSCSPALIQIDALMDEELFGPICPVIKADYKEACKITQRSVQNHGN